MRMGTSLRLAALAMLVFPACVGLDLDLGDGASSHERTGELGRVWFDGGGCNGSTTLAVGSSQRLTVEPTEDHPELPEALDVRSTHPDVIAASAGAAPRDFVLEAHQRGTSMLQVESDGELYDRLGFDALPAARIETTSADAVFAGATHAVVVDEVYGPGSEGEEIVLLGGGFIEWDSFPSGGLDVLRDEHRVALFVAGPAGEAHLVGREPSERGSLLDRSVTVVDPAEAGELEAQLGIVLFDDDSAEELPLSTEVPVGAIFQLRVTASANEGLVVPLSRFDLEVAIEGAPSIAELPVEGDGAPEGPAFEAVDVGTAVVVVTAPVIDRIGRFTLTVVDAPEEDAP